MRTIIKKKEPRSFWKAVPSRTAEDREVSLEARGLLFYILVKPQNWIIQREDLLRAGFVVSRPSDTAIEKNHGRMMSERTLRRLLLELEEAGYLKIDWRYSNRGGICLIEAHFLPLPLDERSSQKGRTKTKSLPKIDTPHSVNMCNFANPEKQPAKLHMLELQHVQLRDKKNHPETIDTKQVTERHGTCNKHVTCINMSEMTSYPPLSLSPGADAPGRKQPKKEKGGKLEKTGLPDDLEITEKLIEFCRTSAPDINLPRVFEDFKDHARETERECVNWHYALQRWCRNAQDRITQTTRKENNHGTNENLDRGFELLAAYAKGPKSESGSAGDL